ncbi:MAG: hypothetical protein R3299_10280, partial [Arenibacter sp.]|nr:hypothetical protein [Arenibacter sp.]
HPNMSQDEARQITAYIQSLADTGQKQKSLPTSGTIRPSNEDDGKVMVISASYTDQGNNNVKPLTGTNSVMLKSNSDSADAAQD